MARRALGPRRQADRLRQARGSADARSRRSSCSSSSTTWSTSWAAAAAVEYVHTVLRDGTSADRQLAVYRETGDLKAVVRDIVEQTKPRASGVEQAHEQQRAPMKIGLLCGREYSFPPAFIDAGQRRSGSRTASRREMVKLGGTKMDEPARVPRHRRSHLARGRVLPRRAEARGAAGHATSSTTRSGGRPTTSSSTTR